MSYKQNRIKKSFRTACHISMEDHPHIVIMSDCHRGCGTWADSFLQNRPIYTAALKHYYRQGYTYIELGDGDELWENRRFSDVYKTHEEIYRIFQAYHDAGRLFMVFGNHDRIKENSAYVWRGLTCSIPFHEAIIIDSLDLPPLHLFHGYQGDLINDQLWRISRWLVRYLWRPLEIRGIKDPTSAAKNYTKIRKIEEDFIDYSCREKCILVAGHTHKPTLMQTDCGMYFNSGSAVHPGAITAIELSNHTAYLVKWTICSDENMHLYICREILNQISLAS
ncbi:MAG: metallophosphoesterase [Emergencia sp.]|nr:metallophosphoesterase family protein [Emergencia sp.]